MKECMKIHICRPRQCPNKVTQIIDNGRKVKGTSDNLVFEKSVFFHSRSLVNKSNILKNPISNINVHLYSKKAALPFVQMYVHELLYNSPYSHLPFEILCNFLCTKTKHYGNAISF